MKGIRVHAAGGPEVMRYEDVPEGTPKSGEAAIKVDAAEPALRELSALVGFELVG